MKEQKEHFDIGKFLRDVDAWITKLEKPRLLKVEENGTIKIPRWLNREQKGVD